MRKLIAPGYSAATAAAGSFVRAPIRTTFSKSCAPSPSCSTGSLTPGAQRQADPGRDYLRATPDPDRGWALAALTGDLTFHAPSRR